MALSKEKIAALVKKAFTTVGTTGPDALGVTFTYTYRTSGVYDTETGVMGFTDVVVTDVPGILVNLKRQEVDYFPADIKTLKLLVAGPDLPTPPSLEDFVTFAGGARWNVKRTKDVPGNVLWTLFLQEA